MRCIVSWLVVFIIVFSGFSAFWQLEPNLCADVVDCDMYELVYADRHYRLLRFAAQVIYCTFYYMSRPVVFRNMTRTKPQCSFFMVMQDRIVRDAHLLPCCKQTPPRYIFACSRGQLMKHRARLQRCISSTLQKNGVHLTGESFTSRHASR